MRVELRDSLEFLYADSVVGRSPRHSLSLDVARGGTASVHVLLNDLKEGRAVRARLCRGGREVREARWFRLVDVPVERNTGPVGFVETKGERNRFVARRAPFRVFDAMEPIRSAGSVGPAIKVSSPTAKLRSSRLSAVLAGEDLLSGRPDGQAQTRTRALRLHLPIPATARVGTREYTVEVQSGRKQQTRGLSSLSLTVNVHRPVIPPTGRDSFPYTNWFSLEAMAERHGLRPWSPGHWRMIRRYAELMAHGRQNTFWCPLKVIFRKHRKRLTLDRDRLGRLVRTFTRAGMYYIEGGHFGGRTGGEWEATTLDVSLSGERPSTRSIAQAALSGVEGRAISPEGHRAVAQVGRQLMAEIERQGWRDRWMQHVADEPTEAIGSQYRMLAGMVRKYMPGVPILDATMEQSIVGAVDVWCPQAQEYQKHRRWFAQQQAAGDRVWFYTCCFPGGPWLNRLLDMELLRPALFGWAAALYGLEGYLHWGLNHYKSSQDPFQQSVVEHGANTYLPAGDTHIVYPGPGGPWSSVRLEAQREGCEDYELLIKLQKQNREAAQTIVHKVIRGFDRYTKDPGTFRAARKAMLEALGS